MSQWSNLNPIQRHGRSLTTTSLQADEGGSGSGSGGEVVSAAPLFPASILPGGSANSNPYSRGGTTRGRDYVKGHVLSDACCRARRAGQGALLPVLAADLAYFVGIGPGRALLSRDDSERRRRQLTREVETGVRD